MKCCGDCVNRKDDVCLLFDDVILSFADSCFMNTENTKGDVDD